MDKGLTIISEPSPNPTDEMSAPPQKMPLQMLACPACGVSNFVAGDLPALSTVPCGRCHGPILIPTRLHQFELRRIIGVGGMGTVYQALDLTLQRQVAVKLIHKELAQKTEAEENFRREARICAALNHTHIIGIYSFQEHAGQFYIVMELADGGSLQTRIEQEHRLAELEVLDIGIKVASALGAALKKDLLHCDIKPGNLLFNSEGEPKLVDFGLARTIHGKGRGGEDETTRWATPYYAAPERIKGELESFASDLYSLAATLFHALTGSAPFDGAEMEEVLAAHLSAPVTPPHEVSKEISRATSEALCRALAKRPAERHQSYSEFIMELTAARSQLLVRTLQQRDGETRATSRASASWWHR